MAADCPVEATVRERVAVMETLLLTVTRSVEKLAATVEMLSERVNQERGQNVAMPLPSFRVNLRMHCAPAGSG